jgi:AcrR family transcriptional regulator
MAQTLERTAEGVKPQDQYAGLVAPTRSDEQQRRSARRGSTEVREALLHAAAELFAAKGFAGTSTKEIAKAANTSETTIYRHFSSKADLFSTAVLEPFSSWLTDYPEYFRERMAQESWTDQEITAKSIERLYHHMRANRNSVLAMVSVHADPDAIEASREASLRLDAFFDALHDIGLERWRRDPAGLDPSRLRLGHRLLVGLIFCISALDRWFVPHGPDEPTADELVQAITDFAIRGLVDNPHGTPLAADKLPEQLQQLIAMHDSGALTDAEFSAAKAKLLG